MKAHNITHIIHVGALSSPEVCEREPNRAYDSNVRFTEMLAEYATRVGVHLTTVSTDLVFDGSKVPSDGFIESDPPHSLSVYARSKLSAERITLRSPTHTVVRLALLYGHSESRSLGVLGWMEKALSAGAPLSLFGDEYRTPIHVLDAAHAVLQLSERALPGLWHCGGPTRLSRVEFGMLVAKALGYDASLILASSRLTSNAGPARPEDVSLNSEKLWTTLEMVPRGVLEALG
jgi:dTDP-4-dehydrorhamnose reductase